MSNDVAIIIAALSALITALFATVRGGYSAGVAAGGAVLVTVYLFLGENGGEMDG